MKVQLGEAFPQFVEAINAAQVTSIRLNPRKTSVVFPEATQIPWSKWGKYLKERPQFAADPLIFGGAYYVQEASSMFLSTALAQTLNLEEDLKVLDLCAAPGGKSTLILSHLTDNSLLVANELMRNRLPSLLENLTRWGAHNRIVTSGEASQFQAMQGFFDAWVIDAPCSGEGMFRKDYKAVNMWSEGLVQSCSSTQRQILDEIAPALKTEGILIYSTCTFAPQENEQMLSWLSEKEAFQSIKINIPAEWGIVEEAVETPKGTFYGYRFYPHKIKGEGFFMACFRKVEETSPPKKHKKNKRGYGVGKLQVLPRKYHSELSNWIKNVEDCVCFLDDETLRILPDTHKRNADFINAVLPYKQIGLEAGKFRKGKLTPAHPLALSHLLANSVPRQELSYEDAIRYLRKDDVTIENTQHTGWVIMTYQDIALGWAKFLPNRINNYYPTEMRLRKEIL